MKSRILIVLALSLLLAPLHPQAARAQSCNPPAGCYGWSPNIVWVGTTVTFNAGCSYDSDGTIVSYQWDFGDGTTGSGPTPTHVYSASAAYSVTLTVVDNDGNIGGFDDAVPVLPNCSGFTCYQEP
jgi:hypothetical protein